MSSKMSRVGEVRENKARLKGRGLEKRNLRLRLDRLQEQLASTETWLALLYIL
jgi:hypothetical protein